MSRNSKYVDVAFQVLEELGGGPISSKALVKIIVEKGLLEDRKYLYHNVLRKIRQSELFDTSERGVVKVAQINQAPDQAGVPSGNLLPNEEEFGASIEIDVDEAGDEEAVEVFSAPSVGSSF